MLANEGADEEMEGNEKEKHKEQEEEEEEAEKEEEENKGARTVKQPSQPSAVERARHEVTHMPFRSWCSVCCRGRSVKSPQKNRRKLERYLPTIHVDYGHMGQANESTRPLLVAKDDRSEMVQYYWVGRKGIYQ